MADCTGEITANQARTGREAAQERGDMAAACSTSPATRITSIMPSR